MPFGEYKDFKDCVSKNKNKKNPEGYCAQIHKNITGKYPNEKRNNIKERIELLYNFQEKSIKIMDKNLLKKAKEATSMNQLYNILVGNVEWGVCETVAQLFYKLNNKNGKILSLLGNWRGFQGSHIIYQYNNIVYDPIMKFTGTRDNYNKMLKKRGIKYEEKDITNSIIWG